MFALKLSRISAILFPAALCAITLLAGCGKSSNLSTGTTASPPASALTAIASCIEDNENDVIIGGPDAKKDCQNVEMDPSSKNPASFGTIEIAAGGTLHIEGAAPGSSSQSASISRESTPGASVEEEDVHRICVESGGTLEFETLEVGKANAPITNEDKVILEFVGSRNSGGSGKLCKGDSDFRKGIVVQAGGSLLMYGAKGVPSRGGVSWTTLAAPAGPEVPGAKVTSCGPYTPASPDTSAVPEKLALTADVTKGPEGWEPGDWIVVATTDYVPFHSEFVQIKSVKSGGASCKGAPTGTTYGSSTVTLKQPLQYYHFGSLAPSSASPTCTNPFYSPPAVTAQYQPAFLCDGAKKNYGVDERAEVGLISRDIELTAETDSNSVHWGGEIMIHAGFKQVAIQGVRLSKFGKDKLGSYPIHFHLVGTIGKSPNPTNQSALIDADSVDHSYNKCVTIHATSNLKISNLVCARIVGHIFYEELQSRTPDLPPDAKQPALNENNPGDDSGIVFDHDLGIGAMSNSFDIYKVENAPPANTNISRAEMIKRYWWTGDYMTNDQCAADKTCINYDGFNIPDTDNQLQATHGFCYNQSVNGQWSGGNFPETNPPTPCNSTQYYIEPASGFWIQNPGTQLTDDAIAGCQGDGVGYWWVPPQLPIKVAGNMVDLRLNPLGKVEDDRSSACYHAYFAEGENNVQSGQLSPIQNGAGKLGLDAPNIIAHFTGLTATHDRWRALWLRGTATWFVVKDAHLADDNRGASLVTSGGVDGNGPGIWQLLQDSVLVGMSEDNVGRWGPCPKLNALGVNTGFDYGCIDYSHPTSGPAHSGEVLGKGYPGPDRNSYGFQIYDGPALMYHLRFVNYNYNSDPNVATDCNTNAAPDPTNCAFSIELDNADRAALGVWDTSNSTGHDQYEGDAALGWFPSNQNAYPTATTTRQLLWVNTNLRHQIFTDKVNIGTFNDGDKNTAILDEDGTLSGFGVKLAANATSGAEPVHAFSLNNLPFNATSNSVDECFSRGAQNVAKEDRDSSLMSPETMGTLEFANLYPFTGTPWPGGITSHWQNMIFTRTDEVPGFNNTKFRPSMTLNSRNGQGYWEPRISNGYGYTVRVKPSTSTAAPCKASGDCKAGIYKWIDVGVADVLDPNLSKTHPFYILLGIDYARLGKDGKTVITPTNDFIIKRGYKSYFGGVFSQQKKDYPGPTNLFSYFTLWTNCNGLDGHRTGLPKPNIPYNGQPAGCPAGGSDAHTGTGTPPSVSTLSPSAATNLKAFTENGPDENKFEHYYYNPKTGYLWLYIVQDEYNAEGPSPLGSCGEDPVGGEPDPACPWLNDESYYICPKNGCIIYTIAMNDSNYQPGTTPSPAELPPAYLPPAPATQNRNQLVKYGTSNVVVPELKFDNAKPPEPYYVPAGGQSCKSTQPPQTQPPQ